MTSKGDAALENVGNGAIEKDGEPDTGNWPPPRLLRHRFSLPGRSPGFYKRPALAARCTPTAQRLTLLIAPGGFGKTTLLAECCHDALERGVPVAWLTLDEKDGTELLDTYLACAFEAAGVDVIKPLRQGEPDAASIYMRTAMVLRAVEARSAPIVLALDEAERLSERGLVGLVNFLLRAAPPHLHIAIAARELPPGLNVAAAVLDSEAEILTADDLRFTETDIHRFYGDTLSPAERAEVVSMSQGWPIALRIRQNETSAATAAQARLVRDVMENWVESRLWNSFAQADQEFLLDVGLFEWFDAELLSELLGEPGAMRRLQAMRALDGLLEPVRGSEPETFRLHSLIRSHCASRRLRETPERFRRVHEGIARVLARRGHTAVAMRHADLAGDTALLATILQDAGGAGLWFREGLHLILDADRVLTDEAVARYPRLRTVRCIAHAAAGRLPEARRNMASISAEGPETSVCEDMEIAVERFLARAAIGIFGCESTLGIQGEQMMSQIQSVAEAPGFDPGTRYGLEFGRCVQEELHASFGPALERGYRLLEQVRGRMPSLACSVNFQLGQIAMAQGRVHDALNRYREGHRSAVANYLEIPGCARLGQLFLKELEWERNRLVLADTQEAVPVNLIGGTLLAAHFAVSDIAVDLALVTKGVDAALALAEQQYAQAVHNGLPALERHLAAHQVALLADAGRVEDAERVWTVAELPDTDAGCVDLVEQSWREAESLACARLRLLIARGAFDAGRRLGRAAMLVANKHELRRTLMRVTALCLRLEHLTGDSVREQAHLKDCLVLIEETDYARPLVREGGIAKAAIERFVQAQSDSPQRRCADRLLAALQAANSVAVPEFTRRELEVLRRMGSHRDNDIAAALGISRHGVRYHVGKIFRKLKINKRHEAVHRARNLGILPQAD